jgi:L-malate glycosyltransferase
MMPEKISKTKLLFVLLQLDAGGAERVVLDLARNIDKTLFDIYVVSFSQGDLYDDFSAVCTKLFHVHRRGGYDFGAMMRIGHIIKKYSIDVVNAHHYAPFFYSYLGSTIFNRSRLFFTVHSVPELVNMPIIHKHVCELLCYRANGIIGISNEISLSIRKAFPSHLSKVIYIPNAVNVDLFSAPVDRDAVRAELNIPSDAALVGMIANFHKVKNHLCLIKAFDTLRQKHPHLRLVLVGKGFPDFPETSESNMKAMINLFRLEDSIILTGYRHDISRLLKAFDIFCLPSFSEGLPVSILEAMAARIPVVGSDVQGIREVISPENTGLLFPSNDHVSLAAQLERLITDAELRVRLQEKAFDFVSQNHGMRQWISRYQDLFLSVT